MIMPLIPIYVTPFLDETIKGLRRYSGIPTVGEELAEYVAIKKALATLHFIETLLSEDKVREMAEAHTQCEEDYQSFILSCEVISDKIKEQANL